MKFNKKAALELSITAIVVLIIAITVLGLGIGFIKKQFGAGTELVQKELSNIKEQLKEQVRTGGELLVFSVPEQVSIGKPQGVIIGVRNTLANPDPSVGKVCFVVEVRCLQSFSPDGSCEGIPGGRNNIAVGGYDSEGWLPVKDNSWFRTILGRFDLKNYEGDVFDAIMLVRGIKPDSYQMEINVYASRASDYKDCGQFDFSEPKDQLYASKSFILNVV